MNLEITKEDAVKAHENAKNSGKKLLENLFGKKVFVKDIKERVKTLDDAIEILGEDDKDVIDYRRMQSMGLQPHILGNQELIIITKALNEGWKADWHNGIWDKWFNYFNMSSSSSGRFSFDDSVVRDSVSDCGSRLCFKSKELAQYAATQFLDIYQKTFTI